MTREELKAALRAAADDYKRATDEAVAAYSAGYGDPADWLCTCGHPFEDHDDNEDTHCREPGCDCPAYRPKPGYLGRRVGHAS